MTVAYLLQETDLDLTDVWAKAFSSPIHVFNVESFGVSLADFLSEQKQVFNALPADPYDMRKEQIEFLVKHTEKNLSDFSSLFENYYTGMTSFDSLKDFHNLLSDEKKELFAKIVPYRFRGISRFMVDFSGCELTLKQIPTERTFVQRDKLLEKGKFDFRTLPRVFKDLEERFSSLPLFHQAILGVSSIIRKTNPHFKGLDITIHHVRVKTTLERITSNSPEGIHQDGFPFIVSALVVEREGVEGAESQIFGSDRKTKIFTTTLMPGYGLLQPDLDTPLWHCVTKIIPLKQEGYRSSIGFDIQPIE